MCGVGVGACACMNMYVCMFVTSEMDVINPVEKRKNGRERDGGERHTQKKPKSVSLTKTKGVLFQYLNTAFLYRKRKTDRWTEMKEIVTFYQRLPLFYRRLLLFAHVTRDQRFKECVCEQSADL